MSHTFFIHSCRSYDWPTLDRICANLDGYKLNKVAWGWNSDIYVVGLTSSNVLCIQAITNISEDQAKALVTAIVDQLEAVGYPGAVFQGEISADTISLEDALSCFALVDAIYNGSFEPKSPFGQTMTKRDACAKFLNLPDNHPVVDWFHMMHEHRIGQKDAIDHRCALNMIERNRRTS
jgi:hypothetical protein